MNEQTDIAEPSKAGLSADELEAKRISRRAAIKKAAAVAGAVWVAPTIIDSLASPAAAVTAAKGTFSYQISKQTNGCTPLDPLGSGCNPTGYNAALPGASAIVSVACTTSGSDVVATVTINGGYSCTFTNAAGTTSKNGTVCGGTVSGLGTKTLSLSGTGIPVWRFTITCPS